MGVRSVVLALSAACVAATGTRPALACGTSGPGGVEACSLDEHAEAERPKLRVGAGGLYTSTSLHFTNSPDADETRSSVVATLSYFPSSRVSLQAGLGATLVGRLVVAGAAYDFSPGPAAILGASWRVLDASGARPFVVLTALMAFEAATTTGGTGYEALDLRGGAVAGWTLAGVVSPFLAARVFGGPVFWRYAGASVVGTDARHFQLGGGVAVALAKRVDLFVEGIPLGEVAVSGGVGVSF